MVREGWVNAEGKKGEPRLQFVAIQYLQDVLVAFAKKLIIQLNVADLQEHLIMHLSELFKTNRGDHSVLFEVMELERVKRQVEVAVAAAEQLDSEAESEFEGEMPDSVVADVEDVQVVTKLSMPSRKLKIKISNELLHELEKLQVGFKLN